MKKEDIKRIVSEEINFQVNKSPVSEFTADLLRIIQKYRTEIMKDEMLSIMTKLLQNKG